MSSQPVVDALAFAHPTLGKGLMRAAAGNRLEIVSIQLGETPVEADLSRFVVVSPGGILYAPIAVGGAANTIMPVDRLPVGREIGQILPSDAILAVTRRSATAVTLEAGPGATLAFVYEIPTTSSLRTFRMPDGGELPLRP